MATTASITVIARDPARLIDHGLDRLAHLEQIWSRFRGNSDISRINTANGAPVAMSIETRQLLAFMKAAHTETGGAFNPTLLPLQVAAGDTTSLDGSPLPLLAPEAHGWTSLDEVTIFDDGTARVPADMVLDAGGIGKGLAADIVARELVDAGAEAACVNIGGDLSIARRPHCSQSWPVTVAPPRGVELDRVVLSLRDGAVATSDATARRRRDGTMPRHHVTVTGLSEPTVAGATVVASHGGWAEAWTKAALTNEPTATIDELERRGLAARIVLASGEVLHTRHWTEFVL